MYGASIAQAPNQVRIIKVMTKVHKITLFKILKEAPVLRVLTPRGKKKRIKIDIASATTPPSLEGIERKIAYANKKYHSG